MEKKKLRINIVDIIILAVILLVCIFIGSRFLGGTSGDTVQLQKVRVTFFQSECEDYIHQNTKIGDRLYDDNADQSLGVVTGIELGEPTSYQVQPNGSVAVLHKEGYSSVLITGETEGIITENGVIIGGELYGVGHSFVLRAGIGKYYLKVHSIEAIGG